MMPKYKLSALHFCLVSLHNFISCGIIYNSTQKSLLASESLEKSGKNTKTPVLSTRFNLISASTVLNPPRSSTVSLDWTLENFRRWVKYSSKPDALSIPNERLNNPEPVSEAVRDEREDIFTEDPEYSDSGASGIYADKVSSHYIFKGQGEEQRNLDIDTPYYETGSITISSLDLQSHEDENVNSTVSLNNSTSIDLENLAYDAIIKTGNTNHINNHQFAQPQLPPLSEALHASNEMKHKHRNVSTNHRKQEIDKVSKEPINKESILESLTEIQFNWVDIIIAVCCTAAILLILINIGEYTSGHS